MTSPNRPHGFALPTLMGLLALTSLAALLAWRNLWVNDLLLNAQADQLRTQYKAQAVLPIAVQDIVGVRSEVAPTDLRHTVGNETQTHVFFPASVTEYQVLRQRLGADTCRAGICAPTSLGITTNQASHWKANTLSARLVAPNDTPDRADTAGYWVEVFPQTDSPHFVYRITTFAHGVLPSSTTVLQALWTRATPTSPTGQWHSLHVLHD